MKLTRLVEVSAHEAVDGEDAEVLALGIDDGDGVEAGDGGAGEGAVEGLCGIAEELNLHDVLDAANAGDGMALDDLGGASPLVEDDDGIEGEIDGEHGLRCLWGGERWAGLEEALQTGGRGMGLGARADIGRAVVFLVGPDSRYVTGITLPLDGGQANFG